MSEQPEQPEQPVDPNEQDQHDQPAKQHGDKLEEVVTDRPEMHDEQ
jgi:hypothetical protein